MMGDLEIGIKEVYEVCKTNFHLLIVKYDVFVSFRGVDVRHSFVRKVAEALRCENIDVYTDDRIQKGEEIGSSLNQAIERSLISLVIFSPNYFNSHWCLIELTKILESKDKYDQIVIPVFFNITPSEVRNQTGKCAKSLSVIAKEYGVESQNVKGWISDLTRTANISGFCLSTVEDEDDIKKKGKKKTSLLRIAKKEEEEDELIKEIVKYVLSKLDEIHKKQRIRLDGLDKQISHVDALLMADSKDVRAICIWGMAGGGKTIIAEGAYDMIHLQFDACVFMPCIREKWMRLGRENLKKKLYSNILKFRGKKVLVVLDDVNDADQLEYLIGSTLDWFGKGSRIIITTRDKQVLPKWVDDDDMYEVKPLNYDDSCRLFNLHAFDRNHPKMDYDELFKKKVDYYAQGNPLVLKELGHFCGKDTRTWKSQLEKLEREPSLLKNVYDAIKVSYNDLSFVEKKVFLFIAFHSDGLDLKVDNIQLPMKVDNIQLLLKYGGGGYNLVDVLHSLKNKGLLTISQDNVVSMYIIIQVMARRIIPEESNDLGKKSKLLKPNDKSEIY